MEEFFSFRAPSVTLRRPESLAPGSAAVSAYDPVVHMMFRCGREQSGRAAALLWQLKEYGGMPPGSLFGKRTFSPPDCPAPFIPVMLLLPALPALRDEPEPAGWLGAVKKMCKF